MKAICKEIIGMEMESKFGQMGPNMRDNG